MLDEQLGRKVEAVAEALLKYETLLELWGEGPSSCGHWSSSCGRGTRWNACA
jgi:hypothetical protein